MVESQQHSDRRMVDEPAPDFELPATGGKTFRLSHAKGASLVLYFYPKDNTPGCTTQACEFRDNIFAFRKAKAVILGVSVDDVASHAKFAADHSLPFPILADSGKTLSQAFGVLYEPRPGAQFARRETFIVDPQGRIAKHYTAVDPKGHSALVLADLKVLKKQG